MYAYSLRSALGNAQGRSPALSPRLRPGTYKSLEPYGQRQDAPKSWTKIIPSPRFRYPLPSPIQSALLSIQAGIRRHQQSIDALPIRHPKGVRGHRQSIDALHIKPKGIERVSKRHPKDIQRASKRDPRGLRRPCFPPFQKRARSPPSIAVWGSLRMWKPETPVSSHGLLSLRAMI